ncbi:hypothetical protein RIF29_06417 [Crotalaria pallida]|uniref:Uncharacterized protein n=1 Tax=Crotalaria pallida TaxID=3830 RepID=A0AAN9PAB3_CROPI
MQERQEEAKGMQLQHMKVMACMTVDKPTETTNGDASEDHKREKKRKEKEKRKLDQEMKLDDGANGVATCK